MKRINYIILAFIFLTCGALSATEPALDLDVSSSIDLAIQNNLLLQKSAAKILQAEAKLKETQSVNKAQFNFQAVYTRMGPVPSFDIPMGGQTQSVKIGNEDNYNVGLTLQKALATFGRQENAEKLDELNYKNDKLEYIKSLKNIVYQVKQGYYDIIRSQKLYNVAQEAETNFQNHLNIAQANFKAGTVPRYDILRAEVSLANSKQYVISTQNGVELALANFKNTLGVPLETAVKTKDENDTYTELSETEYWNIAQTHRQEIQQAYLNIEVGETMQKLARANDKPNLSFNTTYNVKNSTVMTTPQNWNANVVLNYPFYDSGITRNKLVQAQEYTRQAVLLKDNLERNIKLEIKQAYLGLQETKEKLQTAKKNVEQAKEALKIAEVRYQSGMGTLLELSDSQLALSDAEVIQTLAEFDLQMAFAKLEQVTGSSPVAENQKISLNHKP